ncbi:response regulator transcription factor [Neobacillus sp. CF12]|uniref:response regulator n=1 Tax=Neobacillus sp. CF12 TaxID=3055864 RepID=UPI0025A0E51B|nr:response regulator transcription factor [Neobacillus sp. CF12]MDM5326390.1 response regulator transcription factor [Neobacillus sp. CF12]
MIRIVIAEDQALLLEAMGNLLNLEDDIEVVGQAGNGVEALTLVQQLQPDVCIMDIEMPEKNGLEAAEVLQDSDCKVIILTTFARPGYYQRALRADVRGYLLKDNPSEELASSIRSVMDGMRIYSNELLDEDCNEENIGILAQKSSQNNKGSVKNYLSSIMDKIKLPTG